MLLQRSLVSIATGQLFASKKFRGPAVQDRLRNAWRGSSLNDLIKVHGWMLLHEPKSSESRQ